MDPVSVYFRSCVKVDDQPITQAHDILKGVAARLRQRWRIRGMDVRKVFLRQAVALDATPVHEGDPVATSIFGWGTHSLRSSDSACDLFATFFRCRFA